MPILGKSVRLAAIALAVLFIALSLFGEAARGSSIARPPRSRSKRLASIETESEWSMPEGAGGRPHRRESNGSAAGRGDDRDRRRRGGGGRAVLKA